MSDSILTKVCPKCGETKPIEAFYKHKGMHDGLQAQCKACSAKQAAAYYAANKERYLEKCAIWAAENKDRKRETNAAWLEANRERRRETDAAWARANPNKVRQRVAAWREANPDRARAATAKWQKANPEAVRIHSHTRRASTEKNGGKLSRNITNLLMSEQGKKCAGCLVDLLTTGHHLDHVVPISKGGPNVDSNIQLLCPTCNHEKSAKHPLDWMQQKGIFSAHA